MFDGAYLAAVSLLKRFVGAAAAARPRVKTRAFGVSERRWALLMTKTRLYYLDLSVYLDGRSGLFGGLLRYRPAQRRALRACHRDGPHFYVRFSSRTMPTVWFERLTKADYWRNTLAESPGSWPQGHCTRGAPDALPFP